MEEPTVDHFSSFSTEEIRYLHKKVSTFFSSTEKENVQVYGRVWNFQKDEWQRVNKEYKEVEITEIFIGNFPLELSLLKEILQVLNGLYI